MINFTTQIPGTPDPQSFRFDAENNVLYTDTERENPVDGMDYPAELEISEKSAEIDPQCRTFWNATRTQREAYMLCEQEGISLEDALTRVNSNGGAPATIPTLEEGSPPPPPHSQRTADPEPVEEPVTNSAVGIVISNQQLILEIAFKLLDRYIEENDVNMSLLNLLKKKVEELNEHEISI